MRSVLSRAAGGPESLEIGEIPTPTAGPGQLLVQTSTAALNYFDLLMIRDMYQSRPPRPFAPACELSGTVRAVGEGVTGFSVGDMVAASVEYGALAEFVVTDASRSMVVPPEMPSEVAASMLLTYGTTIHALKGRAQLKAGETLFVLGASGGVGLAAVELGKAMGATVVAAVSTEEKAHAARNAGADRAIVYPRTPFDKETSKSVAQQFKDAVGPGGADVIYDPVGGDYSEAALRAIAWNGRHLVIGFTAGIPALRLNLPLLKECSVMGVFWGGSIQRDPASFRQQASELIDYWRAGKIRPLVSRRFPMKDVAEAYLELEGRRSIGKIVVKIPGDA